MRNRLSLKLRASLQLRLSRFFAVVLGLALLDAISPARAASALSAPIEELNARFVQVMQAGKTLQFQQRYTLLAPTITRTFDLAFLLQNAVGTHWATLTPEQRATLTEAFQQYAVSLCAAYFDNYSGERFEIAGETKTSGAIQSFWSRCGLETRRKTYTR